jgi:hypothetical protein
MSGSHHPCLKIIFPGVIIYFISREESYVTGGYRCGDRGLVTGGESAGATDDVRDT